MMPALIDGVSKIWTVKPNESKTGLAIYGYKSEEHLIEELFFIIFFRRNNRAKEGLEFLKHLKEKAERSDTPEGNVD